MRVAGASQAEIDVDEMSREVSSVAARLQVEGVFAAAAACLCLRQLACASRLVTCDSQPLAQPPAPRNVRRQTRLGESAPALAATASWGGCDAKMPPDAILL